MDVDARVASEVGAGRIAAARDTGDDLAARRREEGGAAGVTAAGALRRRLEVEAGLGDRAHAREPFALHAGVVRAEVGHADAKTDDPDLRAVELLVESTVRQARRRDVERRAGEDEREIVLERDGIEVVVAADGDHRDVLATRVERRAGEHRRGGRGQAVRRGQDDARRDERPGAADAVAPHEPDHRRIALVEDAADDGDHDRERAHGTTSTRGRTRSGVPSMVTAMAIRPGAAGARSVRR